ncbi:hypothetical protein [Leptothoe sp. PORK10 BA2]|uniref:hypothetical protein n=1 Tax=Leptothoe sp. PORK10 BA2 TaxID=3110254 RepID=UPI002B1F180D|nr:hypothetical protein [Leptothoe sp. PORK10 BA2]MEA5465298.1 hypothetical protein [Leptothoe sp. PORK10 BA2]
MRSQIILAISLGLAPWLTASSCIGKVVSATVNTVADEVTSSSSAMAEDMEVGLSSKPAMPPAGLQPYALDGALSDADINALLHLSWPQKYESIIDRFGMPAYRTTDQDFYQLPYGRWAAINYTGRQAVSYSLGDSQ